MFGWPRLAQASVRCHITPGSESICCCGVVSSWIQLVSQSCSGGRGGGGSLGSGWPVRRRNRARSMLLPWW